MCAFSVRAKFKKSYVVIPGSGFLTYATTMGYNAGFTLLGFAQIRPFAMQALTVKLCLETLEKSVSGRLSFPIIFESHT